MAGSPATERPVESTVTQGDSPLLRIQGERVFLRELIESDATERYASWLNDRQVNAYLETHEATVESLRAYIREKRANGDCLFLGVFLKDGSLHIGNVKLEPIDRQKKEATFGLLIGDKYFWGGGYGTEATRLIVGYAFDSLGLDRVTLGVRGDHKAAIRVYEKVGFSVDNVDKGGARNGDDVFDSVTMSVTNREFARVNLGR